jgi:hypothetical protein
MAIISLISGIVSWILLPLIGAVVAIITGHMARNEIKNSYGSQSGEGLAIAGLILGYVNVVVMCLAILIPAIIFGAPLLGCGVCSMCGSLGDLNNFSSGIVIPPIN